MANSIITTPAVPASAPASATPAKLSLDAAVKLEMTKHGLDRAQALHLIGLKISPLANVKSDAYVVAGPKNGIAVKKGAYAELVHLTDELVKACKGLTYTKGKLSCKGGKIDLVEGLAGIGVGRVSKATATAKTAVAA